MNNQIELFKNPKLASIDVSHNSLRLFSDLVQEAFYENDFAKHNQQVKSLIAQQKEAIRTGNKNPGSGVSTVKYISEMVDVLIRGIWDQLEIKMESTQKTIAIVAVGGYGRLELCPNSDIDLLILTSNKITQEEQDQAETLVRNLWDYGFEVGSSVRSVKQCDEAISNDFETWTSFLTERFIAGNYQVYKSFLKLINKPVVPWRISQFLKFKLNERKKRIQKFGGLIQLLEPNLKEGTGCLRDVHTIQWISRIKFGCKYWEDLVREGLMAPQEMEELRNGYEFLLRARCCLHYVNNKKEDFLGFHIQPDVAREFGYDGEEGDQNVEWFLQSFYRHSKAINRITESFLSQWEKNTYHGQMLGQVKGHKIFAHEKGRLDLNSPVGNPFSNNIGLMLEYFSLANTTGLAFGNMALHRIRQAVNTIQTDKVDITSYIKPFLNLCKRPQRVGRMLRAMHEVGLVELIIPDFLYVNCHTQHNIYHIYTTDEHTLTVVRQLAYLKGDPNPMLDTLKEAFGHVKNIDVLILSCIYHDIAKALPGDHSEVGAELIRKFLKKAGFSNEECEQGSMMVLHHLAMNEIAQRRNLDDPKTISDFIEKIKSPQNLHMLYVLTYCDISSVHPDAWSDWKAVLLKKLYLKTLIEMEQPDYREHLQKNIEKRLIKALKEEYPPSITVNHLRLMPKQYRSSVDVETLKNHLQMVEKLKRNKVVIELTKRDSYYRISVAAVDRPYLLAALAASFSSHGVSISNAKIFTRSDGVAIDEFQFAGHEDVKINLPNLQKKIEHEFKANLKLSPDELYAKQTKLKAKPLFPQAYKPAKIRRASHVPFGAKFSNRYSDSFSTLDLSCLDVMGLMYLVTNVFSKLEIQVHGAILTTEAGTAMDAFYITDMFNRKIEDKEKISLITNQMEQEIIKKVSS